MAAFNGWEWKPPDVEKVRGAKGLPSRPGSDATHAIVFGTLDTGKPDH